MTAIRTSIWPWELEGSIISEEELFLYPVSKWGFIPMNFKVHMEEDMMSIFWLTGKPYISETLQRRREG